MIITMLKKQVRQELNELLDMTLPELERRIASQFQGSLPFKDILRVGTRSFLLLQKDSIHLINPGSDGLDSVAQVIYGVRLKNTPLTGIFLTHKSDSYTKNLKYYEYLAQKEPMSFDYKLLCHEKNSDLAHKRPCYTLMQDEEFLKLDGRKYLLLKTPGHSKRSDHISILEFEHKVLFVGIMLQPQGESYEYCTFLTPVSSHQFPEDANRSIELLKSLPFEHAITGEGDHLDQERAYRWMAITQRTFERTAYYCRKVLWDQDHGDLRENARAVFHFMAMDRNMSLDHVESRFDENEDSTEFDLYDYPSIAYYLRKFGMG